MCKSLAGGCDEPTWDANFGEPLGINLLGVGDCNNDGVFDCDDADCLANLIIFSPECPGEEDFANAIPGLEYAAESDAPQYAEYFANRIAKLRGSFSSSLDGGQPCEFCEEEED